MIRQNAFYKLNDGFDSERVDVVPGTLTCTCRTRCHDHRGVRLFCVDRFRPCSWGLSLAEGAFSGRFAGGRRRARRPSAPFRAGSPTESACAAGPPRRTRRSGHSPGVLVACLGKGGSAMAVVGSGSRGVPVPSYAAAGAAFAEAVAYLSSRDAPANERKRLGTGAAPTGSGVDGQAPAGTPRATRQPGGGAAGPVERTDEVDVIELSQRRVPEGPPQTTTSATVQVARQTHSSVPPRRRSTSRPPPCATATSRCGTAHHRPTGGRRDGRRVCPTAAGGIGVIRDSDAVDQRTLASGWSRAVQKLPLQVSRDLDACWHSHEPRSIGTSARPAMC